MLTYADLLFKALYVGKESIATRLSAVYSRALQIREHTQVCRYISSVLHRGGALAYAGVWLKRYNRGVGWCGEILDGPGFRSFHGTYRYFAWLLGSHKEFCFNFGLTIM
jgi:hypothetical protein